MIKERITQYLDLKGFSKYSFYKKTTMSNGSLDKKGTIGADKCELIYSEYPDINIEWLITGKGSMLKEDTINIINEPRVQYNSTNKAPLVVTINKNNEDNIVLVPQKASAGYLSGYGDPSFIESLPSYSLPNLRNGIYRMFQVSGHSMYPTLHDKSYVVGEFVEDWINGIKDDKVYVVVSLNDGVVVKRALNRLDKYGSLYCKSDNRKEYPSFPIEKNDIIEIWEVKTAITFEIPNPSNIYDRVNDLEAEIMALKFSK